MFRLFFVVTLSSAILLWYLHQYRNLWFRQVLNELPYSSQLADRFQTYLRPHERVMESSDTKLFTAEELKQYDGSDPNKGIFLSILGDVYDVEKGQRHYGPGGPYHVFAGKDATRAFISGDFDEVHYSDHVMDLSPNELLNLRDWSKFYRREYDFKGKLIGRYYDNKGKRTKYWEQLQEKLNEAEKNKEDEKNDQEMFPPCNVEWNAETGTKVWCSNQSGGIQRDWIGEPRKLFIIGTESYRCACVNLNEVKKRDSPQYARRGHLQQYDHCDPKQHACFIKE